MLRRDEQPRRVPAIAFLCVMLHPILGLPASFHSSCFSAMPDLSITWLRLQQGEFSGHKYRRVEGQRQESSGGITGVRKRHGELKGYGTFSGRGRAEEWRPVALGLMINDLGRTPAAGYSHRRASADTPAFRFLSSLEPARPVFHDSTCAVAGCGPGTSRIDWRASCQQGTGADLCPLRASASSAVEDQLSVLRGKRGLEIL